MNTQPQPHHKLSLSAPRAAEVDLAGRHLGIQGLRGACVLAVFAYHVINSGLVPQVDLAWGQTLLWLASGLRYGVEVFFMISGYVIAQSLRRHGNVSSFITDRFLRIFPLWLPLASVMLLAQWYVSRKTGGAPPEALSSLPTLVASLSIMAPVFPVPGIHPAQWSLNYELCFYGIAATAWSLIRQKSSWRWIWLVMATAFVVLFPRALFFVPGVLVALYEPWLIEHRERLTLGWLGLCFAWVCWLLTGAEATQLSQTLVHYLVVGNGPAVASAFIGSFLFFAWLVVYRRGAGQGALRAQPMLWLGKISYSFYLIHPIVMAGVKRGLLPHLPLHGWDAVLALAIIALPLSCFASWITCSLLEVRLRQWLIRAPGRLSRLRANTSD
ncbi:MAG: acyltransferase [Burkholderiales bacterium]|nr:acyltransferase [Burkholderiales bacterium]